MKPEKPTIKQLRTRPLQIDCRECGGWGEVEKDWQQNYPCKACGHSGIHPIPWNELGLTAVPNDAHIRRVGKVKQ